MLNSARSWWAASSGRKRLAAVVGGGFLLGLAAVVAFQLSNSSALIATNERLNIDLVSAQERTATLESELDEIENEVDGLNDLVAALEVDLADARSSAEDESATAVGRIADLERQLSEARTAQATAEDLVAELRLAYDGNMAQARDILTSGLAAFACSWGTDQAKNGAAVATVIGQSAVAAFRSSDAFEALSTDPLVSTYLGLVEQLGEDPYELDVSAIESTAVGCWQAEDAVLNAALYLHLDVLTTSALDAACTLGASEVYGDSLPGFEATAVFQDWRLRVGYEEAEAYLEAVEDRFGSFEAFLAIPGDRLRAEDERCASIRDLISPKGSATWNVGDEIQPGVWEAFDESDCYWARLAENGDIRDNHFGDALRLTVNVLPTDGQFEVSGCSFYFDNP